MWWLCSTNYSTSGNWSTSNSHRTHHQGESSEDDFMNRWQIIYIITSQSSTGGLVIIFVEWELLCLKARRLSTGWWNLSCLDNKNTISSNVNEINKKSFWQKSRVRWSCSIIAQSLSAQIKQWMAIIQVNPTILYFFWLLLLIFLEARENLNS